MVRCAKVTDKLRWRLVHLSLLNFRGQFLNDSSSTESQRKPKSIDLFLHVFREENRNRH